MTPVEIRALQRQVETLEESVAKLTDSVDELVKAWSTAKGMTSFVKWMASLASACGVLYAALHNIGPK
jgi:cell division septum initiation protein DivIVA